jgi:hypothetical protein
MALTYPKRLQGFWANWSRAVWSVLSAFYLGQTVWWLYAWMYLNNIVEEVQTDIIMLAGVGTAIGFVLPALFRVRGWVAVLVTTVATYIPLYIGYWNFFGTPRFGMSPESFILLYDFPHQLWTVMLPLVILLALGAHLPAVAQDVRDLVRWVRSLRGAQASQPGKAPAQGPTTVPLDREAVTGQVAPPYEAAEHPAVPVSDDLKTVRDLQADTDDDISRPDRETVVDAKEAVEELSSDPDLKTTPKPDMPRTEEFDMDKVGKPADDETDWDAILSPLDDLTEEFEIGAVGEQDDADDTNDEDGKS